MRSRMMSRYKEVRIRKKERKKKVKIQARLENIYAIRKLPVILAWIIRGISSVLQYVLRISPS
jgi:hypothetical protein